MTDEQIKYSIQTERLKLSISDKFSHYGIVGFFFIMPAMGAFLYLKDYFDGTIKTLEAGKILFMIIPLILGILFYLLQRKRLNLKFIETNLNREDIDKIIENVSLKLKWHPSVSNENIIIAKTTPSFFSGSWGEQITILFDKNRILINSICDLEQKSSVVSFGRNKKNVNTLLEAIKKASH